MDTEEKVFMVILAGMLMAIIGLLWYSATLPDDPNARICPVVGNIAICEEK